MKAVLGKNFFQFFFITVLIFIIIAGNTYSAIAPSFIPFSRDNAALLLQKTVKARLIPFVIDNGAMRLTINKLLGFSMDWNKACFSLTCAFSADTQGFIPFTESGEVTLKGCGLLSPEEEKLGVKLLGIEAFKLEHFGSLVSEVVRIILDKGLSGKEFWPGGAPVSSVTLSKENFTMLLKIALNKQLPLTVDDNTLSIMLLQLDDLTLTPEPGQLEPRFILKGTYNHLITFSFEGEAVIKVKVSVDPDTLAGLIRIEEVTGLNLKGTPGFLDSMIRGLLNSKLKGKESQFIW